MTGLHVAIIMDGNGRWATARGLPRTAGHHAGLKTARRIVEAAVREGLGTLTLYAFSSDNWQRPASEVSTLMQLFQEYLRKRTRDCVRHGVRISVIGRHDRLAPALVEAIVAAENATSEGRALHLRIAVDYSSRDAILRAAQAAVASGNVPCDVTFARLLGEVHHDAGAPNVDLLIRTGGEQRLSDFLLWECAYAELHFTRRMWPDFSEEDLHAALEDFRSRERRFGRVLTEAAAS